MTSRPDEHNIARCYGTLLPLPYFALALASREDLARVADDGQQRALRRDAAVE